MANDSIENSDRKYRKYNLPLSSVSDALIKVLSLREYQLRDDDAEDEAERETQKSLLRIAWQSLTQRQKEVITLCVIAGKTRRETADLLNCSKSTVDEHYCSAMEKLRKVVVK